MYVRLFNYARRTRTAALLLTGLFSLPIIGCHSQPPVAKTAFAGTALSGANYARDFHLTDHNGRARTLADFKGQAVVLVFGYKHCPDVCPSTLAELSQAMKLLGPDAENVQVLFFTLDPERDSGSVLAQYVPAFHPRFLGLYGSAADTAKVARDFHLFYQEQRGSRPEDYTLDHTAGSLVFDPEGQLRLFLKYGMRAQEIAGDLRRLFAQTAPDHAFLSWHREVTRY